MNIIAHRGFWKTVNEKNTYSAFDRALVEGYGIETDIRDYGGELVISHDIASKESIRFEDFLKLYKSRDAHNMLALNIKSDGICKLLNKLLSDYGIRNYFVFDMSIPEMVLYRAANCICFTRQSDIEQDCVLYQDAKGVWLDAFYDYDWLERSIVERHLDAGKIVVIVSPELHGKEKMGIWRMIRTCSPSKMDNLYLCTDTPAAAADFMEVGRR